MKKFLIAALIILFVTVILPLVIVFVTEKTVDNSPDAATAVPAEITPEPAAAG